MEATALPRAGGLRSRLAAIGYTRAIRLVVGAGVVLRIAVAIGHRLTPISDFHEYNLLATILVQHGSYGDVVGHPDVAIAPGWPFVLAAAYKVFGIHLVVGELVAAVLECGALVAAALIATKLLRPPFALLAVAILALHPVWIVWSSTLASEHLGLFLATTIIAIFVRTRLTPLTAAAIGLLLGALALNRAEVALALLAGLVVAYLARAGFRRGAVAVGITLAATAVLMAPWAVRNEMRFHEFIPSSAGGGGNLWLGTLSPYYTFGYQRTGLPGYVAPPPANEGPGAQDSYFSHAAMRNIRARPLTWLRYDAIRVREIFFYDDIPAYDADVGQLAWPHKRGLPNMPLEDYWHPLNTLWRIFVVAALVGAAAVVRRWRRVDPAWPLIIVFLVASVILKAPFPADSRGHMTLIAALIVLSGLGAQTAWDGLARRRARAA